MPKLINIYLNNYSSVMEFSDTMNIELLDIQPQFTL